MPQQGYSWEDNENSKSQWIRDTHEARDDVVEVRQQIPAEYTNTPPYDVPPIVDHFNRRIHHYASQIRPKSEAVGPIWEKELVEVRVPPDNVEKETEPNIHGEVNTDEILEQIEWETEQVSLDDLRDWSSKSFELTVKYRDPSARNGKATETIQKMLYLPVYAGDRVVDALNECMNELGWLPEATARPVESDPLL